jgi:hypothetical protein
MNAWLYLMAFTLLHKRKVVSEQKQRATLTRKNGCSAEGDVVIPQE